MQEMRSAGYHPDKITYNALIYACAMVGDGHKALDTMEEMQEYGCNSPILSRLLLSLLSPLSPLHSLLFPLSSVDARGG